MHQRSTPQTIRYQKVTALVFQTLIVLGGLGTMGASSLPTEPAVEPPDVSTTATDLLPLEEPVSPAPAPVTAPPTPPPAQVEAPSQPTNNPSPDPVVAQPQPEQITPSSVVPSNLPTSDRSPAGYNNVFIDPTDYSIGATSSPDQPTVVFSERNTGCQVSIQNGRPVPTGCGAVEANAANPSESASASRNQARTTDGNWPTVNLGPVSIGPEGISIGSTTIASREYYNRMLRPLNALRQGANNFIFPLAIPAPITSLFGWRVHPIYGTERFHSGTDLGAPTGTPVLAAQAGRVSVADFLSGYGLTVILRHGDNTVETRYAHLSQLLVQPGEWVEQGDVIGLVGSTGNSTGPHLHFELRQLTGDGWVALNPNDLLQYAVGQFVEVLNHPLQALGRLPQPPGTSPTTEAAPATDVPFRPAQPNAS